MEQVHREIEVLALAGVDLEGDGVGRDRRDVTVVEPDRGGHGQSRHRPGVGDEVAHRLGAPETGPAGEREVHHLPGAHQHHVAGFDGHRGELARGVEVLRGDRVAGLEHLDALRTRHVEEDSSRHQGADVLDAEDRRAAIGDRRRRVTVVEPQSVGARTVGDVREAVPVGRALQRHGDHVLGGGDPGRVRTERLVHTDHGPGRVDPTGDESHLDAFLLGEGQPEGVCGTFHHRRSTSLPGRPVDQVEGPDPIVGTPPSPVGDTIGQLGEGFGNRLGYGHRHAPVVAEATGQVLPEVGR